MGDRSSVFVWQPGEIIVTKKPRGLYKQGGPGSGFHGHRGRPGEVGGSSKEGEGALQAPKPGETEEEWQARLARRRARRKARKEREKGQQKPAEEKKPIGLYELQRKRVEDIAKKFGLPVDRLDITLEPGYEFIVDGNIYRAGGQYNPRTGIVSMYDVDESTDLQLEGMLAHEVQHYHYHNFRQEAQRQFVEINREIRKKSEANWPTNVDGSLKPEFKEKYWAYDIDHTYLRFGTVDEKDSVFGSLAKKDGVSEYSAAYWKDANISDYVTDLDLAVNETLAEIARIDTGHQRVRDRDVDPLWRELYNSLASHRGFSIFGNKLLFLSGGKGSGHHRHAGRPGQVGGSQKEGGSVNTSTPRRKALYGKLQEELKYMGSDQAVQDFGEGLLDNVKGKYIFGSFASGKSDPNDIDVVLIVDKTNNAQSFWNDTQVFGVNQDLIERRNGDLEIIFVEESDDWEDRLFAETRKKYGSEPIRI